MLSPRLAERLLFFPPHADPGLPPSVLGIDGRDVDLRASDGTALHAWWFEVAPQAPAVLFLHGNASHIGQLGFQAEGMLRDGVSILLLSYRGYGRSEGTPSEEGVTDDARTAMRWVSDRVGGAHRVVVHGRSLGGAVAGRLLATGARPGGLVLESTFTDLFEMARSVYPFLPRFLLGRIRGRFDTRSALARSDAPTLIVHGTGDTLVPPSMARDLREAAAGRASLVEIPGAAHNDLPHVGGADYFRAVTAFVHRVTRRAPPEDD